MLELILFLELLFQVLGVMCTLNMVHVSKQVNKDYMMRTTMAGYLYSHNTFFFVKETRFCLIEEKSETFTAVCTVFVHWQKALL